MTKHGWWTGLLLVLALAPALAGAEQEPMGPPAPQRYTGPMPVRAYTDADYAHARGMWKLYAAGYVADVGTTFLGYVRHDNVTEGNFVFRIVDGRWWRFALLAGTKAGLAIHLYRKGCDDPDTALTRALVFLAVSAAAGTWNVTVAF